MVAVAAATAARVFPPRHVFPRCPFSRSPSSDWEPELQLNRAEDADAFLGIVQERILDVGRRWQDWDYVVIVFPHTLN